jgi:hypothetical protein
MIGNTLQTAMIALQQTNPDKYAETFKDGNVFEALATVFTDLLGPVAPLGVGITIAGMLYIWSDGSPTLPTVVLILTGGLLIEYLPPEAQTVAQIALLGGIALVLWMAWMKGGGRR